MVCWNWFSLLSLTTKSAFCIHFNLLLVKLSFKFSKILKMVKLWTEASSYFVFPLSVKLYFFSYFKISPFFINQFKAVFNSFSVGIEWFHLQSLQLNLRPWLRFEKQVPLPKIQDVVSFSVILMLSNVAYYPSIWS